MCNRVTRVTYVLWLSCFIYSNVVDLEQNVKMKWCLAQWAFKAVSTSLPFLRKGIHCWEWWKNGVCGLLTGRVLRRRQKSYYGCTISSTPILWTTSTRDEGIHGYFHSDVTGKALYDFSHSLWDQFWGSQNLEKTWVMATSKMNRMTLRTVLGAQAENLHMGMLASTMMTLV